MGIKEHTRRNLERYGEALTITTYEVDDGAGVDEHGDPSFTSTTRSTQGFFRQPSAGRRPVDTGAGVQVDIDAEVYVPDTDLDALNAPTDDTPRASEITRDQTGQGFVVRDVWPENNGQVRVAVVKAND